MTTRHTPGPWAVRFDYVVQAPSFDDGRLVPVAQPYGVNSDGTDLFANARLIAAAPDYHDAAGWILAAVATNAAPVNELAALEEMALDGKHVTLDAGLVLDLLKAHAKAKGEQQ
ncbi:hypothetical protein [Achromobacter xylosoxidans]|uniref:hypothetical protein n=1 Tax=Alcaligenes xylosoxydans xylosoxydans TaxID=85698 RepID=UPI0006C3C9C1|nr:hypothetical protein [Achromobacter xylosoxidans]CUI55811.1 Uncharacterised protein [Achromobacter xylosoxidans]